FVICLVFGKLVSAQAATHAFDLKNTATATSEGEIIYLNGGGTFDSVANTIDAAGGFNIVGTEDEIFGLPEMGGTWEATDLVSFSSSKGTQVLHLIVTLHFDLGFIQFP